MGWHMCPRIRLSTQCCCGCPLGFGVLSILTIHLAANIIVLICACAHLIGDNNSWRITDDNKVLETCLAAFCLAGIPLILLAMYGIRVRNEVPVRVYLVYLIAAGIWDCVILAREVLRMGNCDNVPDITREDAKSFACGLYRILNLVVFFVSQAVQCYLIWIVYSGCEDVSEFGSGSDLGSIYTTREAREKQKLMKRGTLGAQYESMYDFEHQAFQNQWAGMQGFGGSKPIFGSHHDVSYGTN